MKAIFVGDMWTGSSARSLARGLSDIGVDLVVVDSSGLNSASIGSPAWLSLKVGGHPSQHRRHVIEAEIADSVSRWRPDLLIAYKTIHLNQQFLTNLPVPTKVHYSPDDVSNPVNITPDYLQFEDKWDLILTTKAHNVDEIKARTHGNVTFLYSAYDPSWHFRHWRSTLESQYLASFIGNYRPDRLKLVVKLGAELPGKVIVAGPRWRRHVRPGAGLHLQGPSMGEAFSRVASEAVAGIVLLNSDNRDTHTCRTFEVPATGAVFLGQRTIEHQALFEEGREALMFDSDDELLAHMRWIDGHRDAASEIAAAGYRRLRAGRHTYADRAQEILKAIT